MESDSAGSFYRAVYAPTLSLVTSPDADEVVARNGALSLDELLRPFSTVQDRDAHYWRKNVKCSSSDFLQK